MNNLTHRLMECRSSKRKILSLFLTAGFPDIGSTVPLIVQIANAGADVIELGLPFSDPVADGPVIQQSSETALRNGISLDKIFNMVREARRETDVPLVFMGYANTMYAYGTEKFLDHCALAKVEGTIIADLPFEESEEYRRGAEERAIATIFLAAPTTSDDRLKTLDRISTGFLYCVSVTGVTGERTGLAGQTTQFLQRVHQCVRRNPVLVGFGIASPEDARSISSLSDGVVIGSTFIKLLSTSTNGRLLSNASDFVRKMRTALDSPEPC